MHAYQMNSMAIAAHHKPQQRKVLPLSDWLWLLGSTLIQLGKHEGGSLYCKVACQV